MRLIWSQFAARQVDEALTSIAAGDVEAAARRLDELCAPGDMPPRGPMDTFVHVQALRLLSSTLLCGRAPSASLARRRWPPNGRVFVS